MLLWAPCRLSVGLYHFCTSHWTHYIKISLFLFIAPDSTNTNAFCTVDITRLTDVTKNYYAPSHTFSRIARQLRVFMIDQTVMLPHYHRIDQYLQEYKKNFVKTVSFSFITDCSGCCDVPGAWVISLEVRRWDTCPLLTYVTPPPQKMPPLFPILGLLTFPILVHPSIRQTYLFFLLGTKNDQLNPATKLTLRKTLNISRMTYTCLPENYRQTRIIRNCFSSKTIFSARLTNSQVTTPTLHFDAMCFQKLCEHQANDIIILAA